MRPSIQLCSGKFFDFGAFTVRDINIDDIAGSLSKLCRFTGHCNALYTVAQHSVIVSRLVPPEFALAGLLHDASEAYINDLSRPLKLINPQYVEYEKTRLWPVIAAKFDLPEELPQCVKDADNIALVTERRDLMPLPKGTRDEWEWARDIPRLPDRIKPIEEWRKARALFMRRYKQLTKEK